MLAENASTKLRVGGRLNSVIPGPHFNLSATDQKSAAPIMEGAMELRAAMQLNANPSLRQFSSVVQFCFRDGCMVMAGVLPSYFLKQLAQEAVRSLEGVEAIDNRIYVDSTYDTEASIANAPFATRVVPR